jgi:hypothetical protein
MDHTRSGDALMSMEVVKVFTSVPAGYVWRVRRHLKIQWATFDSRFQ